MHSITIEGILSYYDEHHAHIMHIFNEYNAQYDTIECLLSYYILPSRTKTLMESRVSNPSTENQRISTPAHSNWWKSWSSLVLRQWYTSNKRLYLGSKTRIQEASWAVLYHHLFPSAFSPSLNVPYGRWDRADSMRDIYIYTYRVGPIFNKGHSTRDVS